VCGLPIEVIDDEKELDRLKYILSQGCKIVQETRDWHEDRG
jgi:Asp-tRNA(Asn)/Glu-tRNA(Gln) amidotransferase B subunit